MMTAEDGKEADEDGPPFDLARSVRQMTADSLAATRRTYLGFVLSAVASVVVLRLSGPVGDDFARLPDVLRIGIPAALVGVEGLAFLVYLALPGRFTREVLRRVREPGPGEPAEGPSLEVAQLEFLAMYGFLAMARMFCLLVAVMLAGLVYRTTGQPWALANLAGTIVVIAFQLPTRAGMERWSRRGVAARLETSPPPGNLD